MIRPKFVTAKGWLTEYALACGYIEVSKGYNTPGCPLRAYMEKDSACYHVKVYDSRTGGRDWESYETLPEARKAFSEALRLNGLQRRIPEQPKED